MKNVLILTYYWPPSGGGGVQRWLKFTKYLPTYGWKPIVIAPKDAEYPYTDNSLTADLSPETEVHFVKIWEPYSIFKIFTKAKKDKKVNSGALKAKPNRSYIEKLAFWLRGNLLIPDPRVFWVRPTVKYAKQILTNNSIEAVITTGPPHSVHLIGYRLQKKYNIKWLADFRDPWSTIDYLKEFNLSRWAWQKQKTLERKVLQNADITLTVSPTWAQELKSLGAKRVEVITNGYDEDDFKNLPDIKPDDGFKIAHFGFINKFRIPYGFFQAVEGLCKENADLAKKLTIEFVGASEEIFDSLLKDYPEVKKRLKVLPSVPHNEVLKQYKTASILLLLLNDSDNGKGHIPGKLFEYLASGRPVLALGSLDGDVANILKETNCGIIFNCEAVGTIIKGLLQLFGSSDIYNNNPAITKYSRGSISQNLAKLIPDNK